MAERRSWIDPDTNEPLIDDYAKQLDSFLATFEDGVVSDSELKAQEERLVGLMKEVEPELSDDLHAKVTRLMCELSAYDIMQFASELQNARPKTAFRG